MGVGKRAIRERESSYQHGDVVGPREKENFGVVLFPVGIDEGEIDCPEEHVHGHRTEPVLIFGENREDAHGKEKTRPRVHAVIEQFAQSTAGLRSTRLFPIHSI